MAITPLRMKLLTRKGVIVNTVVGAGNAAVRKAAKALRHHGFTLPLVGRSLRRT
jgi:hypothetical protein